MIQFDSVHNFFMGNTYSHYKTNAIVKNIQKDPNLVEISIFMNDDSSFSQVEVRSADSCPKCNRMARILMSHRKLKDF